jgi:hypothetical protein
MGRGHLKILFSRTTGRILTRLGTNHPWVKGIQVCPKRGYFFSKGRYYRKSENAPKIFKKIL